MIIRAVVASISRMVTIAVGISIATIMVLVHWLLVDIMSLNMLLWVVMLLISMALMDRHVNIFFVMIISLIRSVSLLEIVMLHLLLWMSVIFLVMTMLVTLELSHPASCLGVECLIDRLDLTGGMSSVNGCMVVGDDDIVLVSLEKVSILLFLSGSCSRSLSLGIRSRSSCALISRGSWSIFFVISFFI